MPSPTLHLHPNQIFAGRYRLVKRLGSGGFAEVWLVYNTEAEMEQALKVYHGLPIDGISVFRREFTRVFRLSHPHILKATDFSLYQNTPYLIMPYCSQGSALVRKGHYNERELAKVMHDIAGALAYLHEGPRHLVHQDVKPDNFLINEDGDYMLADFGISASYNSQTGRLRQSTATFGQTPKAYRAPEFFGEIKHAEAIFSTDIWALGISLYELAVGVPPYGDLGGAALYAGASEAPPPPGFSYNFGVILRECLAPSPWERPAAAELQRLAKLYLKHGRWVAADALNPVPIENIERAHTPVLPLSADKSTPVLTPLIERKPSTTLIWVTVTILGFLVLTASAYFFIIYSVGSAEITPNIPDERNYAKEIESSERIKGVLKPDSSSKDTIKLTRISTEDSYHALTPKTLPKELNDGRSTIDTSSLRPFKTHKLDSLKTIRSSLTPN